MSVTISCTKQESIVPNHVLSTLPSLHIIIPSEQLDTILNDKDAKVPAQALIISHDNDTLYEGNLVYIKTRGNSTWSHSKKPFSIKFPNKHHFFGLNCGSSFILLANSMDESHIRNAIAFDLANAIGLPAPKYAYLSLYINNDYKGLYQITNKVDIGKSFLNITDLDKLNKQANPLPVYNYIRFGVDEEEQIVKRKGRLFENDPEDITGGYLLDNSGMGWIYNNSESGFVSDAGDPIRIRSPKYASQNEVEYIANLYSQMEASVMADDGYNSQTGKHYTEYIDVESFARYYLLNELLLNEDGGFSSFFMYKDSDAIDPRIYAGPIWDFDCSLGNSLCESKVLLHNEIYVGSRVGKFGARHSGGLLYYLIQHNDFQHVLKSCYYNEISPICHNYLLNGKIDSLAKSLFYEAEKDYHYYNPGSSSNYAIAIKKVKTFFENRLKFFDWYYSASENEIVCAEFKHYKRRYKSPYAKTIHLYYPTNEPIYPPSSLRPYSDNNRIYNRALIPELYYFGTDSIVPHGTILYSSKKLKLRMREPNWREIQIRRIQKILKSRN